LSGPLTNLRLRVESRHADPATAAAICQRLHALGRLIGFRTQVYPQRLRVRLPVSEIALDSWATAELQGAADRFILELADSAHDWFDALPAGEPLPLADRPLIVVMDAVPPDVWLDAMDGIEPDFGDGLHLSWHRLECEPDTPSGMAALFGFRGDPADELAARAIPYQQVSGTEAAPLREVLPSLEAVTTAVVVRVSLFDQGAHRAALRLAEMPGRLRDLLLREVLPLRATCQAQGRQVVLTTDHGLSFTARGLSHGAGGVFEQAVPRFEWGTG
jgi:hypothetical protein